MKSAAVGDMVLIYLSRPYSCIKYICKIKEVNKPKSTIEDSVYIMKGDNYVNYGNYMQLELLESITDFRHATKLESCWQVKRTLT
ncbi:hypothetical protein [Staphylococcus epidermidis]|uniref:hypothetical protein n=1 Tax=Staphylococcus epidermidis TaxID=1282 RepID=UPI00374F0086